MAARRRLNISENPPKNNENLGDYNHLSLVEISLINSKIADEIKAAEYLNSAYRQWSSTKSTPSRFVGVALNILRVAWLNPRLIVSFILGHMRFHSVRDKA
jgi:hypothetical protein